MPRGQLVRIIVTIWPPELRSSRYGIENKQKGTCASRQAAGRSTLVLSPGMMEKYFNPQSKKLCRTALSSRIAAISRPGWNLTRHTITYLAPCRDDTDLNEQTGECPLHRPGAGRFQCSELESLIGVPCEKMDPQVIDFRPFT